jgi:hypothetical protein
MKHAASAQSDILAQKNTLQQEAQLGETAAEVAAKLPVSPETVIEAVMTGRKIRECSWTSTLGSPTDTGRREPAPGVRGAHRGRPLRGRRGGDVVPDVCAKVQADMRSGHAYVFSSAKSTSMLLT